LSVQAYRELVVEGESVPCESPARPERSGDTLKGSAAVDPTGQVEERSSRTVDQRGGLFQIKVAHVAKVEI
jgi:hypothetical protein